MHKYLAYYAATLRVHILRKRFIIPSTTMQNTIIHHIIRRTKVDINYLVQQL